MTRVYVMVCRWTALAVVAVLALAGCDDWFLGGMPGSGTREIADFETPRSRYETTSITVRAATPLRAAAAAGSHADVASVEVTVAGNDPNDVYQDPLAETELTKDDNGWSGSLSGLTIGTPLTFSAAALSAAETALFKGTMTATLDDESDTVTIGLSAVDDGASNRIPVVTGITVATVVTDAEAAVRVTVTGSGSEALDYEFSGGTFTPATGSVTLTNGSGTITSSYTAPANAGTYSAQLRVANAQGHRVEVEFEIAVGKGAAAQSGAIALDTALGPVVTALVGKRTPGGVRWTAEVSTQGKASFVWSFSGSGGSFTDATANPTVLTGYTEATTGTLQVTVTDAAGLETTASVVVAAGMFPDALAPAPAVLVINEIDYDTPDGGDPYEFVEIYNSGGSTVDLSGYRFELVNGTDGRPYGSYDGTGSLAAGGYFLFAKQAVIDSSPPVTPVLLTDSVQNGPDGIRIVEKATGRVIDSVHYKGMVPGSGEGTPARTDSGSASRSIGRCPDGFDSNDNGLDFTLMAATPGAANTCS